MRQTLLLCFRDTINCECCCKNSSLCYKYEGTRFSPSLEGASLALPNTSVHFRKNQNLGIVHIWEMKHKVVYNSSQDWVKKREIEQLIVDKVSEFFHHKLHLHCILKLNIWRVFFLSDHLKMTGGMRTKASLKIEFDRFMTNTIWYILTSAKGNQTWWPRSIFQS